MLLGTNPNNSYQSYLSRYLDEYSARNRNLGIGSISPITPIGTQMPADSARTNNMVMNNINPTPGSGNLRTAAQLLYMGPAAFAINQGVGALTGRTLTDRISDAMKNYFGRSYTPQSVIGGGDEDRMGIGPGSFEESMATAESVDGGFGDDSETGYDGDDGFGGGVTGGSFGE